MRVIEIPLNYQPQVGSEIEVLIRGKVLNIRINPTAPSESQVVVELEMSGFGMDGSIDHHDSHRHFQTVATGGGAGG